jgi:hypothetical protein
MFLNSTDSIFLLTIGYCAKTKKLQMFGILDDFEGIYSNDSLIRHPCEALHLPYVHTYVRLIVGFGIYDGEWLRLELMD